MGGRGSGKQSKSERKGMGRMLMMKNRLNNNSTAANQNDIMRSGPNYQSTKNNN